jgi:2-polyprenyl-3-methyl-5-hydroxy-6-metoxy-1,4-benzoquinol methylase
MDRQSEHPAVVKQHFENAEYYLSDNFVVKLRRDIVADMLSADEYSNVLDVASGDGSISLQFADKAQRIVLLDVSKAMLMHSLRVVYASSPCRIARIQSDFENRDVLTPGVQYDVVISLGYLAHTRNPAAVLDKLGKLCSPSGTLIVQNTNSSHIYSRLSEFYRSILRMFGRNSYRHAQFRERDLINRVKGQGFTLDAKYAYISSFLFLSRLLNGRMKYAVVSRIFGSISNNRFSVFGNEVIYKFRNTNRS